MIPVYRWFPYKATAFWAAHQAVAHGRAARAEWGQFLGDYLVRLGRLPSLTPDELTAGSRRGPVPTLGLSLVDVARQLGVTTSALPWAMPRPGGE